MADIELVIKIPESEIPKRQDIIEIPLHFIDGKVCEAGGYEFDVLPKGPGDLIDRKELKQLREQEPCEDCISRQEAIDELSFGEEMLNRALDDMDVVGTEREKYSWGLGLIETNIKDIESLPPVTPQQKIGWWIDDKCSVCGKGIEDLIDSNEWYENEQPKFCPFCGVKLEGVEMTNGDILEEFRKNFPNAEYVDFRPADPIYIPQLKLPIPYAIIVWLKDGSSIIYTAKGDKNGNTKN